MILTVGNHHHLHTLPDGLSIYECKIFVMEQKVAGVLSSKLILPAVIWFKASLWIHIQKFLSSVSYSAWVRDPTKWIWIERFLTPSKEMGREEIPEKYKVFMLPIFPIKNTSCFLKDYWSQLYFLPMGLNNIPCLKISLSQQKAQFPMLLFSMLHWSRGDPLAPEFITEISSLWSSELMSFSLGNLSSAIL